MLWRHVGRVRGGTMSHLQGEPSVGHGLAACLLRYRAFCGAGGDSGALRLPGNPKGSEKGLSGAPGEAIGQGWAGSTVRRCARLWRSLGRQRRGFWERGAGEAR
jgi:hypothetical protein